MFGTKLLLEKPPNNREFFSEGLLSGFPLSRSREFCMRERSCIAYLARASRTLLLEKINCSKVP